MAESLISSPEAPLLGELSAKQTERLYEGCLPETAGHYFLRNIGLQASKSWWPGLPRALPLGELARQRLRGTIYPKNLSKFWKMNLKAFAHNDGKLCYNHNYG